MQLAFHALPQHQHIYASRGPLRFASLELVLETRMLHFLFQIRTGLSALFRLLRIKPTHSPLNSACSKFTIIQVKVLLLRTTAQSICCRSLLRALHETCPRTLTPNQIYQREFQDCTQETIRFRLSLVTREMG